MPAGCPDTDSFDGEASIFNIEKMNVLSDYEGKLIIEWGKSARSWAQKGTTEKPIVAIQAKQLKVFEGFEKLILSYDELKEIVENKHIYESWHAALSSVYAVYLITDTISGKQYVGSAYNKGGLLGRWLCYVETGHGNNVKMIELLGEFPNRYKDFEEVFNNYEMKRIYLDNTSSEDYINLMKRFYSDEEVEKYGVVAIEFKLI